MDDKGIRVAVTIFGREYRVRCESGRQEALIAAASHVDERMRELQMAGNVLNLDDLAITAALNIADDYIALTNEQQARVGALAEKLNAALKPSSP